METYCGNFSFIKPYEIRTWSHLAGRYVQEDLKQYKNKAIFSQYLGNGARWRCSYSGWLLGMGNCVCSIQPRTIRWHWVTFKGHSFYYKSLENNPLLLSVKIFSRRTWSTWATGGGGGDRQSEFCPLPRLSYRSLSAGPIRAYSVLFIPELFHLSCAQTNEHMSLWDILLLQSHTCDHNWTALTTKDHKELITTKYHTEKNTCQSNLQSRHRSAHNDIRHTTQLVDIFYHTRQVAARVVKLVLGCIWDAIWGKGRS